MKVKFWGVRGSIPATLSDDEIKFKITTALAGAHGVDLSNKLEIRKYVEGLPPLIKSTVGSNTPCLSVQVGEEWLILDAGSGLRTLGVELMKGEFGRGRGVAHILISHTHWDHVQGFPFFRPAYVRGNRITFYSPFSDLEKRLRSQQSPEFFPRNLDYMGADIHFVHLEEGAPLTIGGVRVSTILQTHPGRSYGYRLEGDGATVIYATDSEYKDLGEAHIQRYVEFMYGADLLIFDAQYTLSDSLQLMDWGHSSSVIGIDMATRASVKRIALFHFEHTYNDRQIQEILDTTLKYIESDPANPKCEVYLATEGLEFELGKSHRIRLEHHQIGDATVLSIDGRFDATASEQVDERLTALISDQPRAGLVIDLSQTTHLSIAGLKTLLNAQKMGAGVSIVLAAAPENVRKVLTQVGFGEVFTEYDSVPQAVAALEAQKYLKLEGHVLQDRYRIESSIDMSPKAAIFKAFDTWFERPVIVKVLSKAMGDNVNQLLLNEAKAVARLNHPNIATVYNCVEYQNQLYLIREFVEGLTLEHWLNDPKLSRQLIPAKILDIIQGILQGLAYAHKRNVLHRTLRPSCMILADQGVKLINFGLASQEQWSLNDLRYLAPEQIDGEEPSERSDLFAVGVMLYRLGTGQLPFDGDTIEAITQARAQIEPVPPRQLNPYLPLPLERIILNLLHKNPLQRYSSAAMVLEALEGTEPWVTMEAPITA